MPHARQRGIRPLAAALALLVAAAVPALCAGAQDDTARLRRLNQRLGLQLELAQGDAFYLQADAARQRLDLMLQGVTLRSYAIERFEIGWPRAAFLRRTVDAGWAERIWSAGRLAPARPDERIEIRANDGDAPPPEPPVPRSPEEECPAPGRFVVRYAGGLSLEFVTAEGAAWRPGSILLGLADAARAVWVLGEIAPRIRITLAADEFASLYRALPPDSGLLLVLDEEE